jgi:hypothetical protein
VHFTFAGQIVDLSYGWITVAGLVADIVGFLILARDILPEYQIHRWRAQNSMLHKPTTDFMSILSNYRRAPNDPFVGLQAEMSCISPRQWLRHKVGLKPMDPHEPLVPDGATHVLTDLIARWEREVSEAIDKKELELHSRWRPPLRVGISLIVLGFVLQTIGTIVTSS